MVTYIRPKLRLAKCQRPLKIWGPRFGHWGVQAEDIGALCVGTIGVPKTKLDTNIYQYLLLPICIAYTATRKTSNTCIFSKFYCKKLKYMQRRNVTGPSIRKSLYFSCDKLLLNIKCHLCIFLNIQMLHLIQTSNISLKCQN